VFLSQGLRGVQFRAAKLGLPTRAGCRILMYFAHGKHQERHKTYDTLGDGTEVFRENETVSMITSGA